MPFPPIKNIPRAVRVETTVEEISPNLVDEMKLIETWITIMANGVVIKKIVVLNESSNLN